MNRGRINWTPERLLERWRNDYDFKTFIGALASLAVTLIFAIGNGFLGIHRSSLWHGCICVYYIILVFLRGSIIIAQKRSAACPDRVRQRNKVCAGASVLLLLLNASLIVPIILLVRLQKPLDMTLIPALAMSAYTFWKIIMASVHLRQRKRTSNSLVKLLRSISFIDALVSILTLQNTLIMIGSGDQELSMLPVSAVSSGIILVIIVGLSVASLIQSLRALRQQA